MNHKRYFVLLLALVIAIGASAQFASFRYQSTAGILDGDIEHILVPGEMFMVEGWNVYTNLSNFAYQSENLFSTAVSDNYLIGGKGNFGMIQVGALHRSNNFGYAYIDTFLNTIHTDTDGNLEYDMLDEYREVETYDVKQHEDEQYFGLAFGDKETTNFGIGYRRMNDAFHEMGEDTQTNMTTNLITGSTEYEDYAYSNFDQNDGDVWNEYMLSVYQPMDEMAVEFNAFFAPTRYQYDRMENDTLFEDYAPAGTQTDFYSESYSFDEEYKYNYTRWGLNLQATKENDDYLGEVYVAYANHKTGDSESFFEAETITGARSYPGLVENLTWDEFEHWTTGTTPSVYSYARQDFSAGLKYVKKLNKVLFGMGAYYGLYTYTYAVDADYEYYYEYNYQNGDGVTDGADYTQTEDASWSREYSYSYLQHQINLPVGVEFDAWKNVVMRFGANTHFIWSNDYASDVWTMYDGGTGLYTYGDGTTFEYLLENPTDRDDEYYTGNYFDKYTTYYYGAGWTISENMYVDFMGFSNLVNLTGWKVSANVKFL